jgi:hypothetical protein
MKPAKLPFYNVDDVERICSDALAETGYLPSEPGKVNIDRFIEKKFRGVQIIIESLEGRALGFTVFGPEGVQAIHVAEHGGYSPKTEDRRINSTLAHEAGHCLMHADLFLPDVDNSNLFEGDPDVTQRRILCRSETDQTATSESRRWLEIHANRAIGALLMPKSSFLLFMEPFLEAPGNSKLQSLSDSRRAEAIRAAVDLFDVNPTVAKIRIKSIFPPGAK